MLAYFSTMIYHNSESSMNLNNEIHMNIVCFEFDEKKFRLCDPKDRFVDTDRWHVWTLLSVFSLISYNVFSALGFLVSSLYLQLRFSHCRVFALSLLLSSCSYQVLSFPIKSEISLVSYRELICVQLQYCKYTHIRVR